MQGFCGRVGTLADIVFPVLLGADFVDHSFVVRLTLSCRRCLRKTSHASLSSWFETRSVLGGPVRGYISGNLLLDVLGRGSIGSVFRARSCENGNDVAIKFVNSAKYHVLLAACSSRLDFTSESRWLQRLRHPGIITIQKIILDPSGIAVVMPCYNGGDLLQNIIANGPYDVCRSWHVCGSIGKALIYLHELLVVHRDVKAENVLLRFGSAYECTAVLSDFDCARESPGPYSCATVLGSPMYRAPEVWLTGWGMKDGYGLFADVWSFGVFLYTVVSGLFPFDEDAPHIDIQCARFEYGDELWRGAASAAKPLIMDICMLEPRHRLSLRRALHWLESMQA